MKNEFALAFNEVMEEKQLPREIIMEALEAAMVSAYRRAVNASNAQQVEAEINLDNGSVNIYAEKEVVETVQDSRTEVSLTEARQVDKQAKLGSMVLIQTTPQDFGRVAAQTARQVIQQRIKEAERDAQMTYFNRQLGEILSGVVQAVGPGGVTLGLDMKAEGIMPRNQQITSERFRVHDRVRALLLEVKSSPRGPQLLLSRAHRNFLRRMLENEVPEIYHGLVEIRSIAREPGHRSKVAVAALQAGVDPVGACVGIRGVRIQAIVRELHDEKIDVIEWNPDPAAYIAKALSPARVTGVYLNEHTRGTKTATVVVPEDHLSLAIGRDGQNARLAAKLTGWRIDIKSLPEAAADALHQLQTEAAFAEIAQKEEETLPQIENILAKKSEGRPITPEEYSLLAQFVDRVERTIIGQRKEEWKVEKLQRDEILDAIPAGAFDLPLEDLNLSERLFTILSHAGYVSAGDLMFQMRLDSDLILKLNGVGPKAMEEITTTLENLSFPEEERLEQPEAEAEAAVPAAAEVAEPVVAEAIEAPAVAEVSTEVAPVAEAEVGEGVEAEPETAEALAPEAVEAPPAAEPPAVAPSEEAAAEEEEVITDLEKYLDVPPEKFDIAGPEEEDEEDFDEYSDKKKGKKEKRKKKYVEMEYDPEKDAMIVKRKRKHSSDDWSGDWNL